MHGNVWEWCEDYWHDNYEGAPTNGSAWTSENSSKKVIRSSLWYRYPHICRSAYRSDNDRKNRNRNLGFRVVCVISKTT